ncbi:MAG TPA: VOC family protein [Acidimicrobiia bacterium]|jgi:catechol 2,3-dioxygenase-like lactoylglutathione lyase family enzyme|nr:VOC family protein [Acidimicrobiia bacterium]
MHVSYIIVPVSDMDASLVFYRDMLGCTALSQTPEFSFLDGGGLRIGLQLTDEEPNDASLIRIVFETKDVLARHKTLMQRGVRFTGDPRPVRTHDRRRLYAADLLDPDGHVLAITGWVAD